MQRLAHGNDVPAASPWVRLGRLAILVIPVTLLALASARATGEHRLLLALGALFQGLAFVLALVTGGRLHQPIAPAVIMLYVIALSWILLGGLQINDWFFHVAQSLLLVVPLAYFAVQCLKESGALALRRARCLAQQLAQRRDWPADLQACRSLPEVKALRDCLYVDAEPALALLSSHRPEVQIAALTALEFRKSWQRGQPDAVLQLARQTPVPEVRAAAINALANVDDRLIIEALGDFACDPSLMVRQTATIALLWNTEHRWPWVRLAMRNALAHPVCRDDGPLALEGNQLTPDAVADLIAWTTEKGNLAQRAALTLGDHYAQVLAITRDPELVARLRSMLADAHTPAMLRLELARLLYQQKELDDTVLRQMLDPSSPAPVRLIAVEALLSEGESAEATAALRDLARLPNREIALATADVIQRRLGVDLGLVPNQPLPTLQTRQAAEVARRVLAWATLQEAVDDDTVPAHGPELGFRI
jgi:hypothetical protein